MEQEVKDKFDKLPPEKQQEVVDFIDFLFSKYGIEPHTPESIAELRKKNMGWAKGKIWVADDFIEAPIT